jgi:hypothetical protein
MDGAHHTTGTPPLEATDSEPTRRASRYLRAFAHSLRSFRLSARPRNAGFVRGVQSWGKAGIDWALEEATKPCTCGPALLDGWGAEAAEW